MTGADSVHAAGKLGKELNIILKRTGFELCKWKSNFPEVLRQIGVNMENTEIVFSDEDGTTVLGLKWLIFEDKLTYQLKLPEIDGDVTKRKIVRCVAKVFDPVGYAAPVVVKGKMLIQDAWKAKIDWDEKLPDDLTKK